MPPVQARGGKSTNDVMATKTSPKKSNEGARQGSTREGQACEVAREGRNRQRRGHEHEEEAVAQACRKGCEGGAARHENGPACQEA